MSPGLGALELLKKNGQCLRGRCLIWPGVTYPPKDVVGRLGNRSGQSQLQKYFPILFSTSS